MSQTTHNLQRFLQFQLLSTGSVSQALWKVQEKRNESEIVLTAMELKGGEPTFEKFPTQRWKLPFQIQSDRRLCKPTPPEVWSHKEGGCVCIGGWRVPSSFNTCSVSSGTRVTKHCGLVRTLSFMVSSFCSNTQGNRTCTAWQAVLTNMPFSKFSLTYKLSCSQVTLPTL